MARLDLGELGTVQIQLLPEIAPQTVARFAELSNEGYYDGTTFHRVIPGFMIQGGDPLTRNNDPRDDGKGGTPDVLPDDYSDFPALRGSVAMANRGHPKTAQGQFFIVHADSRHLDGNYTIFGRVVEGIEVVDAVTELEIDTYGRFGPLNRPYPRAARIASLRVAGP
ncbi:MAG: peptidylprolyl isomerase [Deltaproteobacteria bacterium]|nr:peptidylprolyl isomerase [Deltaproteobacteria bacterium]MBW2359828.1 peptidylprolyl isomerase [Deltaproteobacteria bacterium]